MSGKSTSVAERSERDHWLGIELRHLAALATVAQEASFSGAADTLGYVQSAISQQIGSLERIVGHRLVDRSARPRSVSVTPAGETLLEHVSVILEQLRLAKLDIDALSEPARPVVSFGVDALLGSWVTADLVGPLLATAGHPAWDRIERAPSRALLRLVGEGALDAAFVALPVASGPFFAIELRRDAYVLVVPAATAAEHPDAASVLERHSLVAIDGCRATATLLAPRRGSVRASASPHSASGPLSALALVRSGVAAAVMTVSDVPRGDSCVATIPLPDLPRRVVGMVWHRDRDASPEVAMLRAAAREGLRAG